MTIGMWDFILICGVCAGTAVLTLALVLLLSRRPGHKIRRPATTASIHLHGRRIVDCDSSLAARLEKDGWDGRPGSLRSYFAFRFAGLPFDFPKLETDGSQRFTAREGDDAAFLTVINKGQVMSVTLTDPKTQHAMEAHLALYRATVRRLAKWTMARSPHPTWIVDQDGYLAWGNEAYRKLEAQSGGGATDGRPVLTLDDETGTFADRSQRRVRFPAEDHQSERWFDLTVEDSHGVQLFHAMDVTAVVRAENAQRSFVQTLTKTFAQLSIGLAIFDRHRRLALFNPALIDLTSLSPEFLSARPDHHSFFDKLRDEMIMPEPRNYATWRDQIMELITAAENGRYQETWSLPHGSTYRVTGRPHPNGAVAFLFEDISAEVTLTRRFREQLDLSQAVMESLDDALAVFSPQGILSYTNAAYRELWQIPANSLPPNPRVSDVSRLWQEKCEPDPTWGDFRDFVVGIEERSEWDAKVKMCDGRLLDCRFKPLQGGATLASFRPLVAPKLVEIRNLS